MRQLFASTKLFSKILLAVFFLLPVFFLNAESIDDLRQKINDKSSEIEKLEREIALYKNELNEIGKQKNTLSSLISQLNTTEKKLSADINLTQKKIDKANLKIETLAGEIYDKSEAIDTHKDAIAYDLRKIREYDDQTLVETILSGEDFTSMWNDIDNLEVLRLTLVNKIGNLKEVRNFLESSRNEELEAKKELETLKSKLADQKKIVAENKKEKDRILKETKNSEANYQKLLKQQQTQKQALEAEIRNYESKIKYILDPSTLPSAGVFSWPLENVYVTQLFGKTASSGRLYASGTHSGVDFRASVGTPVMAMADGIVEGVGDTDTTCPGASFGKWIFIRYDNGLASTYGHMSLNKAYVGQRVARGEVVGYSGATGRVTGPHLHVTVYAPNSAKVETLPSKSCKGKTLTQPIAATNAYLDPMYYLPPYKN